MYQLANECVRTQQLESGYLKKFVGQVKVFLIYFK